MDEKTPGSNIESTLKNGKESLNYKNFGNVVAYAANVVLTYGIGNLGWLGTQSTGDLSDRYQTIVSPASWAFSIWGLIFLFQGIFAVAQLLPHFRSVPLVQEGVSFYYILACIIQICWSIIFGYEIMWLALAVILLLALTLVTILVSQYYTKPSPSYSAGENKCLTLKGILNYWLLEFPFQIHCGWLIAASIVNANVVVVNAGRDAASAQLSAGIVSLGFLFSVGCFVLFVPDEPNYVIPCVFSWASGAIASELSSPKDSIKILFGEVIISAVNRAAATISVIFLVLIPIRLMLYVLIKRTSLLEKFVREQDTEVKDRKQGEEVDV